MKYKLSVQLYTTEQRVPHEKHRENPSGYSIIYRDAIPLASCYYESNSLSDIKQQAELIEKYGKVQYIDVTVKATALDAFILDIPDVYSRVKSQLKRLGHKIGVSTVGSNISFRLSSSENLDTIISKALFIINTEIMKKEQLITRRGMIKVFDELIEPDWYRIVIDKIRSIVIIERLGTPNNFKVESIDFSEILVEHKDSNRIAKYLSKITGKPIIQVGSTLLVDASYDSVQNSIKASREECANEITYILTQRKHHIDPLLYLKCYRDIMNVDKQIDSLL